MGGRQASGGGAAAIQPAHGFIVVLERFGRDPGWFEESGQHAAASVEERRRHNDRTGTGQDRPVGREAVGECRDVRMVGVLLEFEAACGCGKSTLSPGS